MVHQGAAPETCQNRCFDRVSESELGKFNSNKKGISIIYPKVRIDFGQFRPESNTIAFVYDDCYSETPEDGEIKNGSGKSYKMYGISHTKTFDRSSCSAGAACR